MFLFSVEDASQADEELLNDVELVLLAVGRGRGRAGQRDAGGRHVRGHHRHAVGLFPPALSAAAAAAAAFLLLLLPLLLARPRKPDPVRRVLPSPPGPHQGLATRQVVWKAASSEGRASTA